MEASEATYQSLNQLWW